MLSARTFFRPNRSVSQPPSNPKMPPQSAAIHNNRPTHAVTSGLLTGTWSNSAIAGAAMSGNSSNS